MERLYGDTEGLRPHHDKALRGLYRRRVDRGTFLSAPLARALTELSQLTNRRLGLLIDRGGEVNKVIVGDAHRVFVPDLGRWRAGGDRFRGLRLVLTDLRRVGLTADDLTDLTLLQLDAVAAVFVEPVSGLPGAIEWAHLMPPDDDGHAAPRTESVDSVHTWTLDWGAFILDLEAQFRQHRSLERVVDREAVILVGLQTDQRAEARRRLAELARLAETAGLQVLDEVLQSRDRPDGRTVIGQGKLEELVVRSMQLGADALIFDRELTPSQLRNVATRTELKVLDRTQLILDIFAQRATTREGKLQVELAQLRYRAPRLAVMPTAMSRLTGGIGGRGPGETKLELNRRRAGERQTRLERQLARLASRRSLQRARRRKNRVPVVSLVGYTNAGKSTLLNRVTRSTVDAADRLFATLDTTARRFRLPEERELLLTDTVGFIEELPQTLVEAFRATLEELEAADLLVHVLDAADPHVESHQRAVDATLAGLGLGDRPTLLVWNKIDAADPERLDELLREHGGLALSARDGDGVDALLGAVEQALFSPSARG